MKQKKFPLLFPILAFLSISGCANNVNHSNQSLSNFPTSRSSESPFSSEGQNQGPQPWNPNNNNGDGPGTIKTGEEEVFVDTPDYDITKLEEKINNLPLNIYSDETLAPYDETAIIVDLSSLTNDYTISSSGTYVFKGESEYRVLINKKGVEISLFLENAKFDSIAAQKKPSSTTITLVGNNELTGLKSDQDIDAKGTLHIKGKLLINGDGYLKIAANGEDKNALHCSGSLKIENASIEAIGNKNAIKGNDAIVILHSTIKATSLNGDGIKNDNEQVYVEGELEKPNFDTGYVVIKNSNIDINAKDDGLFASTTMYLVNNIFNVTTNNGGPNTVSEQSSDLVDGKAFKVGTIEFTNADGEIQEIENPDEYLLVIEGGKYVVNSNDDAFHSNGNFLIKGGEFDIKTGDDAIHADNLLRIEEADANIRMCYEGLEGAKVEIYSGQYDITAADDGINAADGSEKVVDVNNENCYIRIYGGHFDINAGCNGGIDGDGIDSNGILLIEDGEIYVSGPVNGADSALDSDGGIIVNGGLVCALGAVGRDETIAANSLQPIIKYTYASDLNAKSTFEVKDDQNNVLITYQAPKATQMAFISSPEFKIGETYHIFGNGNELKSIKIEKILTKISDRQDNNQGSQPGPGGQPNNPQPGNNNNNEQNQLVVKSIPSFEKGCQKINDIVVQMMNQTTTLVATLKENTSYVYQLSGKGGMDEDVTGNITINDNLTYQIYIKAFGPFEDYNKTGEYSQIDNIITINL